MSKILVIGAGAAGAMAATAAARRGHEVIVLEKNFKTGKKIYITGKGRCNFTNASENSELIKNTIRNPKFLYTAFSVFSSGDTIDFFEAAGCKDMRRKFPRFCIIKKRRSLRELRLPTKK